MGFKLLILFKKYEFLSCLSEHLFSCVNPIRDKYKTNQISRVLHRHIYLDNKRINHENSLHSVSARTDFACWL